MPGRRRSELGSPWPRMPARRPPDLGPRHPAEGGGTGTHLTISCVPVSNHGIYRHNCLACDVRKIQKGTCCPCVVWWSLFANDKMWLGPGKKMSLCANVMKTFKQRQAKSASPYVSIHLSWHLILSKVNRKNRNKNNRSTKVKQTCLAQRELLKML